MTPEELEQRARELREEIRREQAEKAEAPESREFRMPERAVPFDRETR